MCEIPLRRGHLHCDHQKLHLLHKPFRTKTLCICTYFLKENYGFHYSLLFPLVLNLFDCSFSYALFHIFTLFSHNSHDHSRIRYSCKYFQYKILKFETYSVLYFPSKEAFHWIFYHIRHFDFEIWGKNSYTLRWKIREWATIIHHSSSPPTLRLSFSYPLQRFPSGSLP